jgi:hypothetical protein
MTTGLCLGKLPASTDKTVPTFRWLIDGVPSPPVVQLPAPAASIGFFDKVAAWPMLANDRLENCTIAAVGHAVQLWTAANNVPIIPDEPCAIAGYAHATGYDPATGENNNGAVALDILKYWMHTGLPICEAGSLDLLDGFAKIQVGDIISIQRAISAFGAVYVGVELPAGADEDFIAGKPWADLTGQPGSLGGHAIILVGFDNEGPVCVTWGRLQWMTWSWWLRYGSEAYALLRREWIGLNGMAPSGLTMAQLDAKLTWMRGTLGLGASSPPLIGTGAP